MNSEQKKAVKQTILECRELLEKDIEQVLINYGVYVNKDWVSIRDLVNLSETQSETKKDIEFAIEKLQKGGFDKSKAVKEYIKEVSYTYLNRLAALRTMEVRGLIGEILFPRVEYGNRSFIGARFYEVAREYCKYQQDGGLTYLLNLMFDEIGEEIKTLFNTEDEYSFISPSNDVLLKVTGLLCSNIDEDSWKQDEIIGWIYQYFIEKEKKRTYERANNENGEFAINEIPAVTQFFTPDWIVKWIVDNSLGTIWEEMKQGKREGKRVEDIKLLDPCCGSGHFLVKAYDLFYQMYLEEGKYTREEIPYKILENNIYGIDIDLRAVQLTALILFIKTKTYLKENGCNLNTRGKLVVNLVCADSILLDGTRLEALKEKHKNNKTILKMIDIIYDEFKDVRLKGSLIQPEKKLFPLFEEYKNRIAESEYAKAKKNKKRQAKGQIDLIDNEDTSLEEYKSKRDFTKEEKELMDSLYAIYNEAVKANDITRQLFANEAVKSVRLVDVFMRKYDVLITNPPYMGRKYMNTELKRFIDFAYEDYNNDLYSVFIERCISLTEVNGFIGMITQNTFMFIKTFEKVRYNILNKTAIVKLVHLGPRSFEDISGEKVNTAMYILKMEDIKNREFIGEYIKLDDIKNPNEKMVLLSKILNGEITDRVYFMNQIDFKLIDGYAFVYWISEELRGLFHKYKPLKYFAKSAVGFQSGNDSKFFRFYWEVKKESLGKIWMPCAKGGGFGRYYKSMPQVVYWKDNGKDIKEYNGSVIRNEDYYLKKGISSSLLGGKNYSSRVLPKGYLFNVASVSIFPYNEEDLEYFLGLLNSSLSVYLLNCINPTNNIPPGTLDKLPVNMDDAYYKSKIEELTKECVKYSYKVASLNEISYGFKTPFINTYNSNMPIKSILISEIIQEYRLNAKIDLNSIVIDKYVFDLYGISENERIKLLSDLKRLPFKKDYENQTYITALARDQKQVDHIKDMLDKDYSVYDIAHIENIDIRELYEFMIKEEIWTNNQIVNKLKRVISYYIGVIFGRWESPYIKPDDIIPVDSSIFGEDDIVERLYQLLSSTFDENILDINFLEIEKIMNQELGLYIINDFFDDHCKLYKNRPIYWHICSHKKTFNCFVYYHKLDGDALYKVKNIYLSQMIDRYNDDLKYYNEQFIDARAKGDKNKENDTKKRCSDLEEELDDLYALDKEITEILPYKPDLDQGVLHNIIPLEPILSSTVSTEKEREEYYKEVKR